MLKSADARREVPTSKRSQRHDSRQPRFFFFGGQVLVPANQDVLVRSVPESRAQADLFGARITHVTPDRGRIRECAREDDRVRYIEATGEGVAAARNQGIAAARAPLVAPLDADDLWLPTKLERELTRLGGAGDDAVLAYTWT